MAQMPFAEHNNMVETIPSDRTDEPLRVSILPHYSAAATIFQFEVHSSVFLYM
jgi:hypothetical protein